MNRRLAWTSAGGDARTTAGLETGARLFNLAETRDLLVERERSETGVDLRLPGLSVIGWPINTGSRPKNHVNYT
jgi:hypothetical protein